MRAYKTTRLVRHNGQDYEAEAKITFGEDGEVAERQLLDCGAIEPDVDSEPADTGNDANADDDATADQGSNADAAVEADADAEADADVTADTSANVDADTDTDSAPKPLAEQDLEELKATAKGEKVKGWALLKTEDALRAAIEKKRADDQAEG